MARYDGLADWYDERVGAQLGTGVAANAALDLLGHRAGSVVDIGCGTGLFFTSLVGAGWSVTGVDISADQLRVASERARDLDVVVLQADALMLPFADDTFDAACLLRVLTDVDQPAVALREAARVVVPGGAVVVIAVHPCFVGPNVRLEPDGSRLVFPGYRAVGWHDSGPGIGDGIRGRVGTRHMTLAELLTGLAAARLRVEVIVEPGDEPLPTLLGFRARVEK